MAENEFPTRCLDHKDYFRYFYKELSMNGNPSNRNRYCREFEVAVSRLCNKNVNLLVSNQETEEGSTAVSILDGQ